MADPFLAEVRIWGLNFAPRNWAFCNGQILAISQNTALFSLIGTYYGGNGVSNFALPDMQSRVPMGAGDGPGLSSRVLGEEGGVESVTLSQGQMPGAPHNHSVGAQTAPLSQLATPANTTYTRPASGNLYASPASPTVVAMASTALPPAGGGSGQPHENRQPYLTLNFTICISGIFPARN